MASLLSSTSKFEHVTALPPSVNREKVISMLSDYEFFLSCDPLLSKFELLPDPSPPPQISEAVRQRARGGNARAVSYKVTDIVHALPKGLWDTNVVSTYEFVDLEDGIFVRIKSPLSVVLETFWTVRAKKTEGGGEGEGLELVEDVTAQCNKLLMGIVKGECEGGWEKIHAKMVGKLTGQPVLVVA